MIKQQADICVSELKEIKHETLEELYLIIKYSFQELMYYIQYRKSKMDIPKRCLNIVKEFIRIVLEERKIINFLIDHIHYIEEENLDKFIEKLNELNEQTIEYFYNNLDNFEEAIDLNNMARINDKKDFKLLPENNEIKAQACDLVLSKEFIKSYLGYEEEFWRFIDARTIFSDEITDYTIEWEYDGGSQIKLLLTIPVIKDLQSALNCVKAYNKAHIIYFAKNKTSMENPEKQIKKYYVRMRNYLNVE